ncbi:MAG: YqhA family protein [Nitrospinae bacterium]|nr:YqhA family protein [Nitrospinota bacterium]
MLEKIESVVERALWGSRLIIFLAVVASIISSFILILIGTYDVIIVVEDFFHALMGEGIDQKVHDLAITHIISAVDSYLIATVLMIFGMGLYELFISKIDVAETDDKSSKILVIHDLDQLKEKLAKVILLVLIVTYFKHAVYFEYKDLISLLYLSIGILLIAMAIYLTHKNHGTGEKGEGH